jgi:hypothetical protein
MQQPATWVDALLSPAGQQLLELLAGEDISASNELALLTRLRAQHPPELVAAALTQTRLRRKARAKFERADAMYFTEEGLEQASSERMARNHARRFESFHSMADLCTGIGGDLLALAADRAVLAVDRDPTHLRLAQLNAAVNGARGPVQAVCADVRDVQLGDCQAVFIDPARRVAGRRLGATESDPPLDWCLALGVHLPVGIKAGPALPRTLVPSGWEVEFVSEKRELKEALLWSPALHSAARRATLLPSGETLVAGRAVQLPVRAPGAFLLDPDPAVTRAGLVEELGHQLGAWKIDEQVAFLSSAAPASTPFARSLLVLASLPWNLKQLRATLRQLGVGTIDIRKRGSAVDVDEVQRKLKLEGSVSAVVVLTRVADRPWMFVCEGAQPS